MRVACADDVTMGGGRSSATTCEWLHVLIPVAYCTVTTPLTLVVPCALCLVPFGVY